ncbi:type I restriction-modification system endonuclease [Chryseosolibacter indicus]|uniref:Type I restriction-modification system endonuclease n=1 Tax=Chryseosolibacter indicus TaxID=2782351 RepID=A0ABS5VYL9_9BACT|nr:type I restriction-modification system endonuclease [Chryseosolibacter indicus]MBT1706331.1 type I restriction-modification system endonuclease [Chryseosolibacter indicus]
MTSSNFGFLEREFPLLFNTACSAEYNLHTDPVTALFKLRQFGEKLVAFIFETHGFETIADDTFHNRIRVLEDEGTLPPNIASLLHNIKHRGNIAVHQNKGTLDDAKTILFSAFKLGKWFYETYSEENKNISDHKFSIPRNLDARHALHELEKEYGSLEAKFNALLAEKEAQQLNTSQKEEIKARSEKASRKIDLDEAETRELIDNQLRLAGWEVDSKTLNFKLHKTLPQKGKNVAIAEWKAGDKWADYALFVGLELYAIVEAKKYAQDISTDLRQAKVYAELVTENTSYKLLGEWNSYKVPFLFSTNGRPYLEQIKTKSGIWFLDVRNKENTSRPLQAWFSPEGLVELYKQDTAAANAKLKDNSKDFLQSKSGLGLREYQIKAIDKVEEAIVNASGRKRVLLAMATGTGKTRTIMGLCYRLIQSNRFKRILFLVDRTALGIQAINAFRDNKIDDLKTFSDIYRVDEMKKAIPDVDTRLHFATVQSLVKRLFYKDDEEPGEIPTIDTYDCIIIDEAHRGYLLDKEINEGDLEFKNQQDYVSKYRKVLDYFDAFAIGLTATPALHTTEIFGKPVYNYSYREAVIDGFLVDHEPPIRIKTKLSEEGIIWEKGEKPKVYEKETNSIKELDALEDELKIEVEQFNKLVLTESFNRTVVKQLVQYLDPEGSEKTLVFAASDPHADLLVQLFKEEFKEIGIEPGDNAIAKITGKSYDPLELIKLFKNERFPNIAVTVDLLTTGIDVPAITNLVFMRRVRSRILYEQMLGRATRLCEEIKKETFRIFDAVGIYEALEDYTNMKPVVPNPSTTFKGLVDEIQHFESNEERLKLQIEQIIAKLQRKGRRITHEAEERFAFVSGGKGVSEYISMLKDLPVNNAIAEILKSNDLWTFLDEFKPSPSHQLWSDPQDEAREPERGYGKGKKPEDYITGFKKFLEENENKIAAIKLIRTRPTELDRRSLKELYMLLDNEGYTDLQLRHAWKDVRNEDIAADLISFIRTLSLGTSLVPHDVRIKNAVDKIRKMRKWNMVQTKWLDRFEAQLKHETILQKEDLDRPPFSEEGGFKKLDKVFENNLESILQQLNENLYSETA